MRSYLGGEWVLAIFNRVVREGLAEKVTLDQRPSGGERVKDGQEEHSRKRSSWEGHCMGIDVGNIKNQKRGPELGMR